MLIVPKTTQNVPKQVPERDSKSFTRFVQLIIFSAVCLTLSGCASIVHGTRQKIAVSTNPTGATVSDGETTVQSPGTMNLKRNQDYILTITKPGYETETVKITHVISGAVAGNLLAGGFIGWGVDAVSGAQWRLEPETITVNLRPLHENEYLAHSKQATSQTLTQKLEELSSLKEKNLITETEYVAMREIAVHAESPVTNNNS